MKSLHFELTLFLLSTSSLMLEAKRLGTSSSALVSETNSLDSIADTGSGNEFVVYVLSKIYY